MEKENKKKLSKDEIKEVKGGEKMELGKMIKEALEISKRNQKDIQYIKRFVIWFQVWSALKFFIILVPIILGILYLPPFLENWFDAYREVLPINNSLQSSSDMLNLNELIK